MFGRDLFLVCTFVYLHVEKAVHYIFRCNINRFAVTIFRMIVNIFAETSIELLVKSTDVVSVVGRRILFKTILETVCNGWAG